MQRRRKPASQSSSRRSASRQAKLAEPSGFAGAVRAELALIAGIVTTVMFFTMGENWLADLDNLPWLVVMFAWLFGVMVWCAFGVVRHADALAELLGEPYGTLILTVSVISIEVTILATIMLGGSPNPTLPRDTMFAILMIVLNGMVGTVLTIGGLRHVQQQYNLQGATAFLAVITPLAVIALVVPAFTQSTADPSFTPKQAIVFGLLTALLYAAFLIIQTTRHRGFFCPAGAGRDASQAGNRKPTASSWGNPLRALSPHFAAGDADAGRVAVEAAGEAARLWD